MAVTRMLVHKMSAALPVPEATDDPVALEEPLEIGVQFGAAENRRHSTISVTMRTPGHDPELASGFLFTEGIIPDTAAIRQIIAEAPNRLTISLQENIPFDLARLQRHFYMSSSCGVCGKTSIESLYQHCPPPRPTHQPPIDPHLLYALPAKLREHQVDFNTTGGLHAAALFDREGQLETLREDIGRHNALDKTIGYALNHNLLPLSSSILLLSGRACFELIQKAAMAGIKIVVAIGPPSSLAIQLAETSDMTLIGFLREQRFNIYTGAKRINCLSTPCPSIPEK